MFYQNIEILSATSCQDGFQFHCTTGIYVLRQMSCKCPINSQHNVNTNTSISINHRFQYTSTCTCTDFCIFSSPHSNEPLQDVHSISIPTPTPGGPHEPRNHRVNDGPLGEVGAPPPSHAATPRRRRAGRIHMRAVPKASEMTKRAPKGKRSPSGLCLVS